MNQTSNAWLLTASLQNWEIAQANGVFGCHGNRSFLKDIKKGDTFLAYVPSLGFIGFGEVKSEYFKSHHKIWEDKSYNHRFQITTPFISTKLLPGPAIVDDLSFVTNKQKWGVFFKSGVRRIPHDDYLTVVNALDKSNNLLLKVSDNVTAKKNTKEIGDKLHNRVLALFTELGFTILENNLHQAGPDIVVSDPLDEKNSKILIQCKNSEELKKTIKNFDKHMYEYAGRVKSSDAQVAILAIGAHKLPKKVPGEKEQIDTKKILNECNVAVWDDNVLDYYEDLIKKIRHFSRYQVLSDLGIKVNFSEDITSNAVKVKQNDYEMYLTSFKPDWLLKSASVVRRMKHGQGTAGYQRLIEKSRLNPEKPGTLSNYLSTTNDWFIPNALVLATTNDSNVSYSSGKLKVSSSYGQFWIIDGQHRLFAFSTSKPQERNKEIACIVINTKSFDKTSDDMSDIKKHRERKLAEVFVTLNGKSKKVPKALFYELYDLLGTEDNPELEIVLNLAQNDFFQSEIKSYSDKEGSINLVSFADAKGLKNIYKYFEKNYSFKTREDLVSRATTFLLSSFKTIASEFKVEWDSPDSYFLKTDRGVRGLLVLLNIILVKYGPSENSVDEHIKALRKSNFNFSSDLAKGLYLGAGGPDELAKVLSKHINTIKPSFAPEVSSYTEINECTSPLGEVSETFLKEYISKLKGVVRCQMMYIDKTTFDFLSDLNENNVEEVRIFFGNTDGKKSKNDIRKAVELLESKGLKITLSQARLDTEGKGGYFHKRWIGDNNIQIATENDLKWNSQKKLCALQVFSWTNHAHLDTFDKFWSAAELSKDVRLKYDWLSE